VEIVITGRHTEVSERFRRLATEKLEKIGQLAPRAHRVDVELSHERNPRQSQVKETVEITVRAKGPVIRAEASAEEPYAALDLAMDKLLERLRRSKDKRKVHYGRQTPPSLRTNGVAAGAAATASAELEAAMNGHVLEEDLDAAGESPIVIRTKDHTASPMTIDQALYEMELVGHDFFLFVDAETMLPSVVYRRRGWSYGLLRLTVAAPAEEAAPAVAATATH
jgi:ribosomal subunit interface protein